MPQGASAAALMLDQVASPPARPSQSRAPMEVLAAGASEEQALEEQATEEQATEEQALPAALRTTSAPAWVLEAWVWAMEAAWLPRPPSLPSP